MFFSIFLNFAILSYAVVIYCCYSPYGGLQRKKQGFGCIALYLESKNETFVRKLECD